MALVAVACRCTTCSRSDDRLHVVGKEIESACRCCLEGVNRDLVEVDGAAESNELLGTGTVGP